jgi:hypothetical protein
MRVLFAAWVGSSTPVRASREHLPHAVVCSMLGAPCMRVLFAAWVGSSTPVRASREHLPHAVVCSMQWSAAPQVPVVTGCR